MDWRGLQHSPVVFWVLAAFAAVGFIGTPFAVWAWWESQPSRQITYYHQTTPILDTSTLGSNSLTLNGQDMTLGVLTYNRLYIWNSGNELISSEDLSVPIKLNLLTWDIGPEKFDASYQGITADLVEGDLISGLRFKKLYRKIGRASCRERV